MCRLMILFFCVFFGCGGTPTVEIADPKPPIVQHVRTFVYFEEPIVQAETEFVISVWIVDLTVNAEVLVDLILQTVSMEIDVQLQIYRSIPVAFQLYCNTESGCEATVNVAGFAFAFPLTPDTAESENERKRYRADAWGNSHRACTLERSPKRTLRPSH